MQLYAHRLKCIMKLRLFSMCCSRTCFLSLKTISSASSQVRIMHSYLIHFGDSIVFYCVSRSSLILLLVYWGTRIDFFTYTRRALEIPLLPSLGTRVTLPAKLCFSWSFPCGKFLHAGRASTYFRICLLGSIVLRPATWLAELMRNAKEAGWAEKG